MLSPQGRGPELAPDDEPVLVGARLGSPLGHTYLSLTTVRCVARSCPPGLSEVWESPPPPTAPCGWGGRGPELPSAAAFAPTGGEASLWDIPINSSTQGPILEQLQLQHKVSGPLGLESLGVRDQAAPGTAWRLISTLQFQERREVELRAKREEEERKRREEKRRQQQQQQEEQKRRQEEEELFRRKQVGPGPLLARGGRGGRPSQWLLSPGAAAGAAAEAAAAAAAGGGRRPRASYTQFPASAVGWPGQAGPVHEDAAGAAAGGRAAPA